MRHNVRQYLRKSSSSLVYFFHGISMFLLKLPSCRTPVADWRADRTHTPTRLWTASYNAVTARCPFPLPCGTTATGAGISHSYLTPQFGCYHHHGHRQRKHRRFADQHRQPRVQKIAPHLNLEASLLPFGGTIGGIENARLPNLKQEFSVVRIFLYETGTRTGDPHIRLLIHQAVV